MRGDTARPVRRAGTGNGPGATRTPRPCPTQPQRHGGDHAQPSKTADHRWSVTGDRVLEPHRRAVWAFLSCRGAQCASGGRRQPSPDRVRGSLAMTGDDGAYAAVIRQAVGPGPSLGARHERDHRRQRALPLSRSIHGWASGVAQPSRPVDRIRIPAGPAGGSTQNRRRRRRPGTGYFLVRGRPSTRTAQTPEYEHVHGRGCPGTRGT